MTARKPLLDILAAHLGAAHVLTGAADLAPFLAEARGVLTGAAAAVVRPRTTEEVGFVVTEAARAGVAVIPQGGNSGLVAGTAAAGGEAAGGGAIVVSLNRMDRVRSLDALDRAVTVEAGVTLKALRDAAAAADCLFPMSLASEGSARVGGLVSTNAGGTAVLRYGNMRELVLGLEIVLPDGRVWHGLRRLRKDNTGYDLKQLFIGAEGTLGIVTAATLKLFPRPRGTATAFAGFGTPDAALALLRRVQADASDVLTAFELIPAFAQSLVLEHLPGARAPLAGAHPWMVLIEFSSARADGDMALLEDLLGAALAAGEVDDVAMAQNDAHRARFWALRENITEALRHEGASIKHDVSVPVSRVAEFLDRAIALVGDALPGARPCPFGHLGDGNIHFNLSQPPGMSRAAFLAQGDRVNRLVHDLAVAMDGSFAAEHGIGRARRDELHRLKDAVSLDLMARLKAALDPDGLLNPGAVL